MRRPLTTVFCLIFCLAWPLGAQQPKIRGLTAMPQGEKILARVQLENLFAPKIVSTIRSGLPAIVQHDFRLMVDGKEKARALQAVEVKYDIWAQRYRLAFPDTVRFAATFTEVEKILRDFQTTAFFQGMMRDGATVYRLRLRVAVVAISAEQSRQLLQRITSNDFEGGTSAAEAGRSGFSLNLNDLISFFFGGEQRAHGLSEWAVSPPLRGAGLP